MRWNFFATSFDKNSVKTDTLFKIQILHTFWFFFKYFNLSQLICILFVLWQRKYAKYHFTMIKPPFSFLPFLIKCCYNDFFFFNNLNFAHILIWNLRAFYFVSGNLYVILVLVKLGIRARAGRVCGILFNTDKTDILFFNAQ